MFAPSLNMDNDFPGINSIGCLLSSRFSSMLFSFFSMPINVPVLKGH